MTYLFPESLDFISCEEIEQDLFYALKKYNESPLVKETINTYQELQKEAETIYSQVNSYFDVIFPYSHKETAFKEYKDGRGGNTVFPFTKHSKTRIYINSINSDYKAIIDYFLAHEAVHAATFDRTEWVEELIAMDLAYKWKDNDCVQGIDRMIYSQRLMQSLDALSVKMRKDEKSDAEIANYIKEKYNVSDELITQVLAVENQKGLYIPLNDKNVDKKIKANSNYYSPTYFTEKYFKQTGKHLTLTIGKNKMDIHLNHLFAHTDDAQTNI